MSCYYTGRWFYRYGLVLLMFSFLCWLYINNTCSINMSVIIHNYKNCISETSKKNCQMICHFDYGGNMQWAGAAHEISPRRHYLVNSTQSLSLSLGWRGLCLAFPDHSVAWGLKSLSKRSPPISAVSYHSHMITLSKPMPMPRHKSAPTLLRS